MQVILYVLYILSQFHETEVGRVCRTLACGISATRAFPVRLTGQGPKTRQRLEAFRAWEMAPVVLLIQR